MTRSTVRRHSPIRPASACPVVDDQARIIGLTKDLSRAMRKLRRDLLACNNCIAGDDCPVLAQVNAVIDSALQAAWDIWQPDQTQP